MMLSLEQRTLEVICQITVMQACLVRTDIKMECRFTFFKGLSDAVAFCVSKPKKA